MLKIIIVFCGFIFLPVLVFAQGQLEVPGSGSSQSGIGIVSGWKCAAGTVTVQFDNGPLYEAGYGTIRTDTQGVCGDSNNGWSFLWNWNKLGDGSHTVKVFDNGVQFGAATITVKTLGEEFRTGLSKTVTVLDFPSPGQSVTLQWQQGQQNFVIAGVTGGGGTFPNVAGQYSVSLDFVTEDCNFLSVPPDLPTHLATTIGIAQNGENLIVTSGSTTFTGKLETDSDFVVASPASINTAGTCTFGLVGGYAGNFADQQVAFVLLADRISGSCAGVSLPCSIGYFGSLNKISGQSAVSESAMTPEEAVQKLLGKLLSR